MRKFRRLLREEEGVSIVEYAVIGGMILVGCIAILVALGPKIRSVFVTLHNHLLSTP